MISAQNTSTNILTPAEQLILMQRQAAARPAVEAYDGSKRAETRLIGKLSAVEDFVRATIEQKLAAGGLATDADRLATALIAFETATRLAINDMLGDASAVFDRRLHEASSRGTLIEELQKAGARIEPTPVCLVPPDPRHGGLRRSDNPQTPFEIKSQSRLAMLVKGLSDVGIKVDDLIIRPGIMKPGMMREAAYTLVDIPDRGCQIAVCDQVGEITFVSDIILHPYVWASYTKPELLRQPSIRDIRYGADWLTKIQDFAASGVAPAREMPAEKLKLDAPFVLHHMIRHAVAHDVWPTKTLRDIDGLPGQRWDAWDHRLQTAGTSLSKVLRAFIVAQAKGYQEKHGVLPNEHSGMVCDDYPDLTWELVERAGLNRPARPLALGHIFADAGLVGEAEPINDDVILKYGLRHLIQKRQWPGNNSGAVVSQPNRHWCTLNLWLVDNRDLTLMEFFDNFIKHSAAEYQVDHDGQLPDRNSGPVKGHEGIDWALLEDASMRRLGHRRMLQRIFIEAGMHHEKTLNAEVMRDYAIRHFIDHDHWPAETDPVDGHPAERWGAWMAAALRGNRGFARETSFSTLISDFIKAKTDEYRVSHEGSSPDYDAGMVAGYPGLDWGKILCSFENANKSALRRYVLGSDTGYLRRDKLSEKIIFGQAVDHFVREGYWPPGQDGPAPCVGETWHGYNNASVRGTRDLPKRGGVRQIIWHVLTAKADVYRESHGGQAPDAASGAVDGYPELDWGAVLRSFDGYNMLAPIRRRIFGGEAPSRSHRKRAPDATPS